MWKRQERRAAPTPPARKMDAAIRAISDTFAREGFQAEVAPQEDSGAGIWRARFRRDGTAILAKGLQFGTEAVVTCVRTDASGGGTTARVAFRPAESSQAAMCTRCAVLRLPWPDGPDTGARPHASLIIARLPPAAAALSYARARAHLLHSLLSASGPDPRLSHVPLNSLVLVLRCLTAGDLARCAAVCQRFRDTLRADECWTGAAVALGACLAVLQSSASAADCA